MRVRKTGRQRGHIYSIEFVKESQGDCPHELAATFLSRNGLHLRDVRIVLSKSGRLSESIIVFYEAEQKLF